MSDEKMMSAQDVRFLSSMQRNTVVVIRIGGKLHLYFNVHAVALSIE
jgi:hypothetical protein